MTEDRCTHKWKVVEKEGLTFAECDCGSMVNPNRMTLLEERWREAVKMLDSFQWVTVPDPDAHGDCAYFCPSCEAIAAPGEDGVHEDDCHLVATIRKVGT